MECPDPRHHDAAWALLLGPGADLAALEPILTAWVDARRGDRDLLGPECLEDLGELTADLPAAGRLVLHAAWLPLEDLGLVRRFLDARPGWDLVLVGGDPGSTVARRLLGRSRARWFHEPLDVEQLDALLASPHGDAAEDEDALPREEDPLRAALDVELDEAELEAFRSPPDPDDWADDAGDPLEDLDDDFERSDLETPDFDDEDDPFDALAAEEPFEALDLDDDPGDAFLDAPRPGEHRDERRRARLTAESEADARLASGAEDDAGVDDEIERILSQPPAAPESHDRPASGPRPTTEESPAAVLARPDGASRRADPFGALLADLGVDEPARFDAPLSGPAAAEPPTARPDAAPTTPTGPATDAPGSAPARDPLAPAPYFKQQVADLADIALRIELSLEMARERALDGGEFPALEDLELEVRRLSQFTRTLGYLAAPPTAGRVGVGLAKMVEEMLAEAGSDDRSPRYLWRTDGPLDVVCDKTLMHHALEAVLYLVHHCAGESGTVRVEGNERAPGDEGSVQLTLRFPAARLDGMSPQDAMVPYALRALLPDLGPNALAAAAGILRGQGGELRLLEAGDDWVWRLRLPRAR